MKLSEILKNLVLSIASVVLICFLSACPTNLGSGGDGVQLEDTSGDATVDVPSDFGDDTPLSVKTAFPVGGSTGVHVSSPIILFMDDKILSSSLADNYTLEVDGVPEDVTLSISASAQGNAILAFRPASNFPTSTNVTFTLKGGVGGVADDNGNEMISDYELSFTTSASVGGTAFDGNGGFEYGSAGVGISGDGAILTGAQGDVLPVEGSRFIAITSGAQLVSDASSIGGTTSISVCGPINNSFNGLNFQADFASSEFNEFVDSDYDDTAVVIVYGPNGVKAFTITSVNIVGIEGNSEVTGFAGLPDTGDDYAGHTGWTKYTISNANVGSPAYIVFLVSDVGDSSYSSALAVDDINFE